MENCPGLKRRLRDAQQSGRFNVAKEFSYMTKKQSGDGWVLVGDAAGFIDPIYSSGVFLALKSGVMAGEAVAEGTDGDAKHSVTGRQRVDHGGLQSARTGTRQNQNIALRLETALQLLGHLADQNAKFLSPVVDHLLGLRPKDLLRAWRGSRNT